MMGREKIKIMFLMLAKAAKKEKDKILKKLEIVKTLEKELKVAERILDGLADKKTLRFDLLLEINKRIGLLKIKIEKLKQKFAV